MASFVLIGAAGYIAPRHMAAIKAVGGELVAALDPHDSVGVLDTYFPGCKYFREFERFDRHCTRRGGIDYVVVCSPNYLHDSHIRFGLRIGARVICEKPVVLNERNLDELVSFGGEVNCILQMRLHPLAQSIQPGEFNHVLIHYFAPRGAWYGYSWKGDEAKSGGLVTNIGSHLFDLCGHLFGPFERVQDIFRADQGQTVTGLVRYQRARVQFTISTEQICKPTRLVQVGIDEFDFTAGFEALHELSYNRILEGRGFTLEDARQGVRSCEAIRQNLRK